MWLELARHAFAVLDRDQVGVMRTAWSYCLAAVWRDDVGIWTWLALTLACPLASSLQDGVLRPDELLAHLGSKLPDEAELKAAVAEALEEAGQAGEAQVGRGKVRGPQGLRLYLAYGLLKAISTDCMNVSAVGACKCGPDLRIATSYGPSCGCMFSGPHICRLHAHAAYPLRGLARHVRRPPGPRHGQCFPAPPQFPAPTLTFLQPPHERVTEGCCRGRRGWQLGGGWQQPGSAGRGHQSPLGPELPPQFPPATWPSSLAG